MSWALEPIQIATDRVSVRTYTPEDFSRIAEAIYDPQGWFGLHWKIDTPKKIESMLKSLVDAHKNGVHNPLVYQVESEIAGITRLMRLEPANKTLEIGGTWVAPKWRKTFVNTEVKYLLLRHCFETLLAERVEFRVDARNIESQRAALRIGGTLEGRLRHRQVYPNGEVADGFLFSIVRPEWEKTKNRLLTTLTNRENSSASRSLFPVLFETKNLLLRQYSIADADVAFELVEKNRPDLRESFPKTFKELSSRSVAEAYILNKLHQWFTKTFFCYGVFLKSTGEHIGQLHIKNINWDVLSAELGYFLDSDQRRKGFGKEMLEAAFESCLKPSGMQRIFLRVLPNNQASIKLAEKMNFEQEGLHRKEFLTGKGELVDLLYFSKVFET